MEAHAACRISRLAIVVPEPLDELVHFLIPPHPCGETAEGGLRPRRRGGTVANVTVDPGGVRPVGFHRHGAEALLHDELARDVCPHPVELGTTVGSFSEEDDAGVPDPIQQRTELDGFDAFERLRSFSEQGGDRRFAAPWARDRRGRAPIGPPLRANERDELHGPQLLLPIFVRTHSRYAHELLGPWRSSHRDHEPPADSELSAEGLRH